MNEENGVVIAAEVKMIGVMRINQFIQW